MSWWMSRAISSDSRAKGSEVLGDFWPLVRVGVWEAVYRIQGLLDQQSEVKPSQVHTDTQGQVLPVYALAHLFGFDLRGVAVVTAENRADMADQRDRAVRYSPGGRRSRRGLGRWPRGTPALCRARQGPGRCWQGWGAGPCVCRWGGSGPVGSVRLTRRSRGAGERCAAHVGGDDRRTAAVVSLAGSRAGLSGEAGREHRVDPAWSVQLG